MARYKQTRITDRMIRCGRGRWHWARDTRPPVWAQVVEIPSFAGLDVGPTFLLEHFALE